MQPAKQPCHYKMPFELSGWILMFANGGGNRRRALLKSLKKLWLRGTHRSWGLHLTIQENVVNKVVEARRPQGNLIAFGA